MKTLNERREMVTLVALVVGLGSVAMAAATGWVLLNLPAIPAAVGYLVWIVKYWRCPHCQKSLPVRRYTIEKIDFCPYCGGKVDEPPVR